MRSLTNSDDVSEAIRSGFKQAKRFDLAYALITLSGLTVIEDNMSECISRKAEGRLLFGTDLATEPEAIESLLDLEKKFQGTFRVRRFQSTPRRIFHLKLAIFTRMSGSLSAVLGSSNLTTGGFAENFESNVLLDDHRTASQLFDYFEELWDGSRARQVDPTWLAQYRKLWAARKAADRTNKSHRLRIVSIRSSKRPRELPNRIRGFGFAFTGKIQDWPRERRLYPLIRRYRGLVAPKAASLGGADCLVHGDVLGGRKSTEKLREARNRGLPIVSEEEFWTLVEKEKRKRRRSA